MLGISLSLPEGLSNSLADLAKTHGQTVTCLAEDVLRNYVEHERMITAQIELAVEEADQGKFATASQVTAMRARCWSWGGSAGWVRGSDSKSSGFCSVETVRAFVTKQ